MQTVLQAASGPKLRAYAEPAAAFDAWLRGCLVKEFDGVVQEPVPAALLNLINAGFH